MDLVAHPPHISSIEPDVERGVEVLAERAEVIRRMSYLLELALMAFDQKKFHQCEKLCRELLLIDPHYCVALELKEDAERVAEQPEHFDYVRNKAENWRKWTDSGLEPSLPYAELVRIPSRADWIDLTARISTSCSVNPAPDIDNRRLTLNLPDATLEDAVAYVVDFSNASIVLDDRLRGSFDWERQVTLHTSELTVREALDRICSLFGITWTLTDERVVFLTVR